MNAPIKKVIAGNGAYRPYRPKPHSSRVERLSHQLLDSVLADEYLEFRDAIANIEVIKLSSNRTGRLVSVRARVLGRSAGFSLRPYQNPNLTTMTERTIRSILSEVTDVLIRRSLPGAKTALREKSMLNALSNTVRPHLSEREYFGPAVATTVIDERLGEDFALPGFPGPGRLHEALTEFVRGGGISKSFMSHQRVRAIENFRQMACHAFKNGATLEDMRQALEEEMVRATMET